jgi:FkbM family methyltransferase
MAYSGVKQMLEPTLTELYSDYCTGKRSRAEHIDAMTSAHGVLSDYCGYLAEGPVAEVRATRNGLVVVLETGLVLEWDPLERRSAPSVLVNEKHYEPFLSRLLLRISENSRTAIDVGANIGYHSLVIAHHARSRRCQITVHAFEPVPHTVTQLRSNIVLNRLDANVYVHGVCLGSCFASQQMFVPQNRRTASSLRNLHPDAPSDTVHVEQITLDSFVEHAGLEDIGLLKIDVEGNELEVIRGGMAMISSSRPPIVIELLRKWAAAFGYHPNDVLRLLAPLGYRFFAIGDSSLRPLTEISDETAETNFLLMPPHKQSHIPSEYF